MADGESEGIEHLEPTPPGGTPAVSAGPEGRPRLWWKLLIVVGVIIAVVVGLLVRTHGSNTADKAGGTSGSISTLPPVGSGYLSTSSTEVIFIQWNQNGSSVSGSAQDDYVEGSAPDETLATNTVRVSGAENGSTISLSFNGADQEFGTISGGSFTLNFPQPDGTFAPVTFTSASPSQFNAAVTSLHSQLNGANSYAAEQQQIQQEQANINGAINTVSSDIAALTQLSFSSLEQQLAGEVTQAQSDHAKTATDAQTAEGEPGSNTQCYDAGTANYDAGVVSYDDGQISYFASQIQSAITSARSQVQGAGADFQTMESDEAGLPSYRPTSPSQGDLNRAVAAPTRQSTPQFRQPTEASARSMVM